MADPIVNLGPQPLFPYMKWSAARVMFKSVALYYYTLDPVLTARSTNYRPRPEDGPLKSALIWLDKRRCICTRGRRLSSVSQMTSPAES